MAMVMRSETPVSDDLKLDESFTAAVGHTNYNIYAQEVADHAYLTIEDKSLDINTYTKEITRGEAVYLLMNKYFHDELATFDTKNITLEDAKDAGNILTEKQAAEHDADAYIALKYAVDHADDGAPTTIYKALCLAEQKGIISSETCWDDSLSMADGIEMLVKTLMQDPSMEEFNFKQGKVSGHEVNLEDESVEELTGVDSTGDDITLHPEEGDYVEPSAPVDDSLETTDDVDVIKSEMEKAKDDLKRWLDAGIITEEEYQESLEILNKGPQVNKDTFQNQQTVDEAAFAQKYEDNAAKAREQWSTNGKGTQEIVEGEYGQGDYSGLEHIRIN